MNGSSQPARRSISFHRSISLSSGWSLFLYAALIILGLVSIVRRRHIEFPLRTTLAKLSDGLFAPKIITSGIRQAFLKIWTPTVLRLSQFRIARILHWAFLAFTAGVISSIIVRGLGHNYLIGWDIVGLHNSPDNVCDIFNTLFGWIPAALNLGPLPDVNTVAAMRLERLQDAATTSAAAAAAFAPAASWLPRLFILYGVCRADPASPSDPLGYDRDPDPLRTPPV